MAVIDKGVVKVTHAGLAGLAGQRAHGRADDSGDEKRQQGADEDRACGDPDDALFECRHLLVQLVSWSLLSNTNA
jgi:hypothetical protein